MQRQATKFILKDHHSDYKIRLTTLHLLPLSLWLEYLDLTVLFQCLQYPSDHFSIFSLPQVTPGLPLWANLGALSINSIHFFYFNCAVKLWNSLPIINRSLSTSSFKSLIFRYNFLQTSMSTIHAHGFFVVHVQLAAN